MAQEEKLHSQDQVDGNILDLAVEVLERRKVGGLAVHELRGLSRQISGTRDYTTMVDIVGNESATAEFLKLVNQQLVDVQMSASVTHSFTSKEHTLIFLKVSCAEKLMLEQYRGILGSVYKTIKVLTNLNPEERHLGGLGN